MVKFVSVKSSLCSWTLGCIMCCAKGGCVNLTKWLWQLWDIQVQKFYNWVFKEIFSSSVNRPFKILTWIVHCHSYYQILSHVPCSIIESLTSMQSRLLSCFSLMPAPYSTGSECIVFTILYTTSVNISEMQISESARTKHVSGFIC